MFRKFGPNDIIINTMRATPLTEFFIYDGASYYNNVPGRTFTATISGVNNTQNLDLSPKTGFVNLYEYNIARSSGSDGAGTGPARYAPEDPNLGGVATIYPYITKDSARASFKTATGGDTIEGMTPAFYNNEFAFGDTLNASYPQVATITRELITLPSSSTDGGVAGTAGTYNRHYVSLKTLLDIYGVKSRHYLVSSSFANKNTQTGSLIHIPSLFFGTRIKPGTISLKWYYTGSLIGELQDTKHNGELIQVSGASANNGKVAGVVLYDEGFMYLTGSWKIQPQCAKISLDGTAADITFAKRDPKWTYWGAGMNDGVTQASTHNSTVTDNLQSASFGLRFEGQTKTQVMTLYCHAKRGEVNYSNNPTFIKYGQRKVNITSSHLYEENPTRKMINTVSSAFGKGTIASGYSASFKRQVYISKVGVYDEEYNLIGVATLGDPVLKEEDEDLAFKLKMDF
jgi:hypothetical protein